jgi:ATP-dependent RNA helicase DeaD
LNKFSALGLSDSLTRSLQDMGFESPSEIQDKAIPVLIKNQNHFIGLAQTGTGKTAAFGLPLIDLIDVNDRHTQAIVLAPTRELGQQIAVQFQKFSKYLPEIKVLAVYGGAPISNQIRALKDKPQIIIATPGRMIDLLNRKALNISKIRYVVLDEADEMLNMGFKEDLDEILKHTPEEKLTWLFSATMPKEIRRIVKTYMHDPVEISVNSGTSTNKDIEHQYAVVKISDKTEAIKRIMDVTPNMKGIIFCRTKRDTTALSDELKAAGYHVDALNGDLTQAQRDRVMRQFKAHALQMVVATDVAARGIDVDNLTHVIHHALPDDITYYTHRSGRTGRAGNKGISIAFISSRDQRRLRDIERSLDAGFTKIEIPSSKDIAAKRIVQWAEVLANAEIDKNINLDLLQSALDTLEKFSKEELISKLVSNEIASLKLDKSNRDLNEKEGKRSRRDDGPDRGGDRRGSSRDRRERRGEGKGVRSSDRRERRSDSGERSEGSEGRRDYSRPKEWMMLNIGKQDAIRKKDLVEFIAGEAKIDRRDIGDIVLKNDRSYFEIEKRQMDRVSKSLRNFPLDDRKLEVSQSTPSGK